MLNAGFTINFRGLEHLLQSLHICKYIVCKTQIRMFKNHIYPLNACTNPRDVSSSTHYRDVGIEELLALLPCGQRLFSKNKMSLFCSVLTAMSRHIVVGYETNCPLYCSKHSFYEPCHLKRDWCPSVPSAKLPLKWHLVALFRHKWVGLESSILSFCPSQETRLLNGLCHSFKQ